LSDGELLIIIFFVILILLKKPLMGFLEELDLAQNRLDAWESKQKENK